MYVAIITPLRATFDIETDLWSLGFYVDAIIDIFFIIDVRTHSCSQNRLLDLAQIRPTGAFAYNP